MQAMMLFVTLPCFIHILILTPYTVCYESPRLFSAFMTCKADEKERWSYRGNNGPEYWGSIFPTCNGREQSPIAINSRRVIRNPGLSKLAMHNYETPITDAKIENNGHTVQVTPTDGVSRTIFVKGSTYRLIQLHFHWGDAYYHGAEHILDGIQYPLELHLVHQNRNNQIAVVGLFFQEQRSSNPELQNIINAFPKVMYKGMSSEFKSNLNLNKLVPANPSSYYRYAGSLTTPGCAEGVTWSVLTKPLLVGKEQMEAFRGLFSAKKSDATSACKLINNYRPVQPLNNRKVYRSQ